MLKRIGYGLGVVASVFTVGIVGWYAALGYYGLRNEISDLRIGKLADQQRGTIQKLSTSIAQLNDSIAHKDRERASLIESHASEIQRVRQEVRESVNAEWARKVNDLAFDDKDWLIANRAILEMYSYLVWTSWALEENKQIVAYSQQQSAQLARSMGRLEKRQNDDDGLTYVGEIVESLVSIISRDSQMLANSTTVHEKVTKYKDIVSSSLAGAGLVNIVHDGENASYLVLKKYPRFGVNLETGQMRELYADLATMPSE